MQIPPVSLDSLLPAANAAAPPATDGGGFARSLRERQDALAAPAVDSTAQSPEQVNTNAVRRDGEPRQGADDNGAELEERGAPLAKEAVQPSPGRGAKAGSGDGTLRTETDPAQIPPEIAISLEVPVPEGVGAAVPFSPPARKDSSSSLPFVSVTDAEAFPEASAQGAPLPPLPVSSLPEAEKPASRVSSPVESSTVVAAVPEMDTPASSGLPLVSIIPQSEAVAASVLGSDPASSPVSASTPAPSSTPVSTWAATVEAAEALAPTPDQKGTAGPAPIREGGGMTSSLSAVPAQVNADPAATRIAEIPGTRGAMTDSSGSVVEPLPSEAFDGRPVSGSGMVSRAAESLTAVPREPSFGAASSLGPGPENSTARADAPVVAPAIDGAPSVPPKGSPAPVVTNLAAPTVASEPTPARVPAASARQDTPATAVLRPPVDTAVIDSVRVTPGQSQPVSLSSQAATGIAALAEGLAPLRETVVPPRLREDLRGQRLDTSSDRRFAQLLGETRGALRVPVAAGESLPVTDVDKGEGAELLFRAPGAQAEPAIFRTSTDNGSNSHVFSTFGQGAATPLAASSGSGTASAAVPFTLPVPEEQVYQQVASRLTLVGGERHSRMTMRLYPEELGQVKLDLTVEGDRVRLHLHAQNQQVQDVLEKYLPRLRESFEQQGLKLEDAQVTSDSPGQGGRGSFQESRQSFFAARSSGRSTGRTAGEEEPVVSPPPTPANPRPGGISLRV